MPGPLFRQLLWIPRSITGTSTCTHSGIVFPSPVDWHCLHDSGVLSSRLLSASEKHSTECQRRSSPAGLLWSISSPILWGSMKPVPMSPRKTQGYSMLLTRRPTDMVISSQIRSRRCCLGALSRGRPFDGICSCTKGGMARSELSIFSVGYGKPTHSYLIVAWSLCFRDGVPFIKPGSTHCHAVFSRSQHRPFDSPPPYDLDTFLERRKWHFLMQRNQWIVLSNHPRLISEIVKVLLMDTRINPNTRSADGKSLLMLAAKSTAEHPVHWTKKGKQARADDASSALRSCRSS